ncbi:MAG: HelD family protein [Acidimicrobiales bacterium]
MALHPDLEAEQAYLDFAYQCLEDARSRASSLESMVEVGAGGTEQARFERDVIWDTILTRLRELDLGDASLVFGRIDTEANGSHSDDTFYIGRLAVADPSQEPVVVDWRAPVAEAFYRATGREAMGLARRRHFATRGRQLLGIEDELFGAAAARLGADPDGTGGLSGDGSFTFQGQGALFAALESNRTGHLGDIVATIQGEQDEIIRAELPGVLVVQGGPGTGKTVVALHRAAYLLYTHRFPLEGQGVLFVGPNRLFLGYIELVLPSLGEAGVQLAVLPDLLAEQVGVRGLDPPTTAHVKGDLRMAKVIARAVRDRKRPLREEARFPYGIETLRLTPQASEQVVADARRRARTHNSGRRYVEAAFYDALAASSRHEATAEEVKARLRHTIDVRVALDRMWPVLTPAQLLHDLYGSRALLRSAGRRVLDDRELELLYRPRSDSVDDIVWSADDVPLLDEARSLLGSRPKGRGRSNDDDEVRTFGHIVVDEAQDLAPMQLRMLTRRSLSGSMTIVGDIAQATGAWPHESWEEILAHLPNRRVPRRAELTVGYRIPGHNMELAARVLRVAAPDLAPPRSIRQTGERPNLVRARPGELAATLADVVRSELEAVGNGSLAVITPTAMAEEIDDALFAAGIAHGAASRNGLDEQVTVVPVGWVKGLELDASVVIEPARIVDEEPQGLRALYVALTRATQRLALVHESPLPECLAE